jgi:surfeit locus 1 family protein
VATTGKRSLPRLVLLAVVALLLFAGFIALGNWQVARRAWKLDLIARVDQRIHAAPVPAPVRADWPQVDAVDDEYRHVRVQGRFLNQDETLVFASTRLGNGYWLMTPLRTPAGEIVLINRGFISTDFAAPARYRDMARPEGPVTIEGLLRMSEPHGAFLHRNQPAAHRWYSRDVAALARAMKLPPQAVAPYFIDADATTPAPDAPDAPVGGLTVVHFYNEHLSYAITWYALALLTLLGGAIAFRYEWRSAAGKSD